uniref:Uncharacterized protein n=1 Tax=viral metagenome TaxID=1070528 RepID=A0A6C0HE22_9ZZZZ
MDANALLGIGIITIIITIMIVVFFPLQCAKKYTEGFISSPSQLSCPSGSTSFIDNHGDLLCCSGEVNGNRCEGSIVCSFSTNLNNKYPSCNLQKKKKYIGPINPFIKQMMSVGFVDNFSKIISMMTNFQSSIKTLPDGQVSKEDSKKYDELLAEEKDWYNNNLNSDSLTYQEECMYIIQRLVAIFSGKPIMNNQKLLQKHVLQQMCAKQ